MKLDVGSGYNPRKGYATCDVNYGCTYEKLSDVPDNCVYKMQIRNVVHHVENISSFAKEVFYKMRNNGRLVITECRKEFYDINFFLDHLWYRGVVKTNIFISPTYRDYLKEFEHSGLVVIRTEKIKEKEITTLKKGIIL